MKVLHQRAWQEHVPVQEPDGDVVRLYLLEEHVHTVRGEEIVERITIRGGAEARHV